MATKAQKIETPVEDTESVADRIMAGIDDIQGDGGGR